MRVDDLVAEESQTLAINKRYANNTLTSLGSELLHGDHRGESKLNATENGSYF